MELSRTFKRIFFPNRDIEKRVEFSGIIDLSPRSPNMSPKGSLSLSPRSGVQSRPSHTYPCKTLFPDIRLVGQESGITFLQQYEGNAQLTSSNCRQNSKVVPVDRHTNTQYRSASNKILARTEDGIPKTFALQCGPRRSTFTHSVIQAHSLYSLQAVTLHGII
ncbi:hypothetical protein AVEN_200748-1 [Araneus ventricosus]|uniref:Uncharacterized protein n=1 Tax=Araneus ventricosus TaxID=182803 RepID=A0A4Y2NZK6_ARAVE|nr:hypothetical protein AVEN_26577-1 [Araneus ventricosus]GBN44103.1 hypothetical protein AVEN_86009-1 [Araneus ventricosus]GBN44106.1 hypothetical protein AVEN_109960-1 [Araneus ventricosus]GBN44125.1 hypothetical protein AVEN_200748-1 [Araneus ventricosus]